MANPREKFLFFQFSSKSGNYFFNLLILEREGKEGRERNIDLLFHILMHSSVYSYMSPDWRLNLHFCTETDTLTN